MAVKTVNIILFFVILIQGCLLWNDIRDHQRSIMKIIQWVRHQKCEHLDRIIRTMNQDKVVSNWEIMDRIIQLADPMERLEDVQKVFIDDEKTYKELSNIQASRHDLENVLFTELRALELLIFKGEFLMPIGYCGVPSQTVLYHILNTDEYKYVEIEAFLVDIQRGLYELNPVGYKANSFRPIDSRLSESKYIVYKHGLATGDTVDLSMRELPLER